MRDVKRDACTTQFDDTLLKTESENILCVVSCAFIAAAVVLGAAAASTAWFCCCSVAASSAVCVVVCN